MSGSISATTVMAGASLALAAAGTAASMAGQAQQAQQQSAMAGFQRQVALNNQEVARRNAALSLQQGEVDVQSKELQTGQVKGSQRAALAAEGGDINSGSPVDIVSDTSRASQTDVDTIRYNAALKAYGYNVEASGAGGTANAYQAAGVNAMANLPYGLGSSFLSGASSAAGKWYSYMRDNPGGSTPKPTYGPEFDL